MKCLACFGSGKVAEGPGESEGQGRRVVYCRRCLGSGVEWYDAPRGEA